MIINLLCKGLKKAHLNKIFYIILQPFFHSYQKLTLDYKNINESYNFLSNISNNPNNSSKSFNYIKKNSCIDLLIIIPVYNSEKYIEECINSIITQKTKYTFLIKIINDGSTDNSLNIIKKYKNYPNIEIINQLNKGHSGARNTGLKIIESKFIMFIDSDDYLAPNAIENLLSYAYKTKAEVVEGNYHIFNKRKKIFYTSKNKDLVTTHWSETLKGFPWGKVYTADLFENCQFPEGYWFEDTLMKLNIYPKCKKVATIKEVVYYYRQNKDGITFKSKKKFKLLDSYWITEQLIKDNENLQSQELYNNLFNQIIINFNRISTLDSERINKAVFILTANLLKQYYPNSHYTGNNPNLKKLEKAIKTMDYTAYKLLCSLY